MRFQFVFSPRVGQHRTIKQMCRSSHTLHLTVFPAQQFKIDTTHTTHTRHLTPFHRESQLAEAAEQHSLANKHQTTWTIKEWPQRRTTAEHKSSTSTKQQQRETQSEPDSKQQQIHKISREVRGVCCVLHVVLVVVVFLVTLVGCSLLLMVVVVVVLVAVLVFVAVMVVVPRPWPKAKC